MAVAPEHERNVLLVTGVAHAATHFAELTYPTLAVVLAHETGTPLPQVLGWSFAGYLLFGLGALPAGLLADHFGARRMLLGALGGMSVGLVLAGLAAPGLPLAASLAVMGLAASAYHPAGMGLISRAIAARGRALAINGIFGNVGIALTPVVTAALAERLGWRGAFLASGTVLAALTLGCARLPLVEPVAGEPVAPSARGTGRRALPLIVLCVAAMLGGISYRGNTLVQPSYFAAEVSFMDFGAATSLVYLIGILGQYAGGVAADRWNLSWAYLAFQAASLPALLLIGVTNELPLLGVASVFVFFSLGMQPIENSLFAQLTPDRWRSTGYGLKFVLTFGVGSLAVWLVRWAELTYGLAGVFPVLAGVVTLMVAAIGVLVFVMRDPVPTAVAGETYPV
jgi:MFS transporter, FSR family, fosmidomycin resistance protein